MRCALALSLILVAGCGTKETTYITSTTSDPTVSSSDPTSTSSESDTSTDTGTTTSGLGDTVDTGTVGATGDPEVVECAVHKAGCTSTSDYTEQGFASGWVMTFDSCGLVTQADAYVGGNLSSRQTFTYDADHFAVEWLLTFAGGLPAQRAYYSYDALRLLVGIDFDTGDNGSIDDTLVWAYDSQRRIILETGQFGNQMRRTAFVHSGNELIGSQSTDEQDNGSIERIVSWDRSLPQALEWIDGDGDGTWEEQNQTTFAADGQPLETVTTRPDGSILRRTTWVYDADGRELEHTIDERDDGTPDTQTLTTWSCP